MAHLALAKAARGGAVGSVLLLIGACSSTEPAGPPPADPVVYAASAETTNATGIATWGYSTDAKGTTTFRGYDALNAEVIELKHVFQVTGPYTRRFGMKMKGPEGEGSVHIEFESLWQDGTQSTQYVARVIENTVPRGDVTQRILDRVAPDAKAIPAEAAADTLAPDAPLLDGKGNPITCCCQLQNNGAALSATAASECAQLEAPDASSTKPATLRALDLVGGPIKTDLIVGADGQPLVDSPWVPPYNIVDNHCHDAATANVSSTNGYIGCHPTSSTTSYSGHTINWAPDPTKNKAGAYCAYEPQANGVSLVDGAACCWEDGGATNGTPLFDTPAAKACVDKMCMGQAYNPGDEDPQAFPPGETPLVSDKCPKESLPGPYCLACCKSEADKVEKSFGSDEDMAVQIADYRKRCATGCDDLGRTSSAPNVPSLLTPKTLGSSLRPLDLGSEIAPSARASRCLTSGLSSNRALAEALAVCGIKR